MTYFEIKNKFYNSELASRIVDNWTSGIPFFMNCGDHICDAFLFYSEERSESHFGTVEMLALADVETGDICQMTEFTIESEFSYTALPFNDIKEYLGLQKKLQEVYNDARDAFVATGKITDKTKNAYLDCVFRLVPKQIVEKIYAPLSPVLFNGEG